MLMSRYEGLVSPFAIMKITCFLKVFRYCIQRVRVFIKERNVKKPEKHFLTCGRIPLVTIDRVRTHGWRPGIKVVLFDSRLRVLLCRLPDGYPHRFNFPGGGIDPGESAVTAFVREFTEEMEGPLIPQSVVANAPVIGEGFMPIPRDDFNGKYEFLIALPVKNLQHYRPKEKSKIVCLPPLPWHNAQKQILVSTQVKKSMRLLYSRALSNIPTVAALAA